MAYTTIEKVREFSGFDNDTKIGGSIIRGKIAMADSKLDGAIGYRYILPLPYHRSNTITFSGTGSGAGTLTATINGTDYSITISAALTASAAADLFRIAVKDSDDFVTDGFVSNETNGDAIVTLISKNDSTELTTANAEVNITDAGGTVSGITAAAGTRQDRQHQFIEQLSTELATALLLFDNYGLEAQDTPKDGVARMDVLDKILAQLQGISKDNAVIRLYDEVTKIEFPQATSGLPKFYGTNTSSDPDYDGDDGTLSQVNMDDKF